MGYKTALRRGGDVATRPGRRWEGLFNLGARLKPSSPRSVDPPTPPGSAGEIEEAFLRT